MTVQVTHVSSVRLATVGRNVSRELAVHNASGIEIGVAAEGPRPEDLASAGHELACAWWDGSSGTWSREGVMLRRSNGTGEARYICRSTHLSDFSVILMMTKDGSGATTVNRVMMAVMGALFLVVAAVSADQVLLAIPIQAATISAITIAAVTIQAITISAMTILAITIQAVTI